MTGIQRVKHTLQAGAQVPGEGITLGRIEVHIIGSSRRVVVVERVHRLHLAGVGVHAPCCLA